MTASQLRKKRQEANLTQSELADLLGSGFSYPTISRMESGDKPIPEIVEMVLDQLLEVNRRTNVEAKDLGKKKWRKRKKRRGE